MKTPYGGFLKWWYPTTMGFPTKNDHFGGVLGVPPFKETPIYNWTLILMDCQISQPGFKDHHLWRNRCWLLYSAFDIVDL